MSMQSFPGQHAMINNCIRDIIDEIDNNLSLMLRLKSHADSMALVLKTITFPENFLSYFSYVNAVLCKYIFVISENNSKLQTVLNQELLQKNFPYNEYENSLNFISKPVPCNTYVPRSVFAYDYAANLPQPSHIQNFGYLPGISSGQAGGSLNYIYCGSYPLMSNAAASQSGQPNQGSEYYTPYVSNDTSILQDVTYLPFTNINENYDLSSQATTNAFLYYPQSNQVRVMPVNLQQLVLGDVEGQETKQEKEHYGEQYYQGVMEDKVYEGGEEAQGQVYEVDEEAQGQLYDEARYCEVKGKRYNEEGQYYEELNEDQDYEEEGINNENREEYCEKSNEQGIASEVQTKNNEGVKDFRIDTSTINSSSQKNGRTRKNEPEKKSKKKLALPSKQFIARVTNAVSPSQIFISFFRDKCPQLGELEDELEALKNEKKYKRPYFYPSPRATTLNRFRLKKLGNYVFFYSDAENTFFRAELVDLEGDVKRFDDFISLFLLDTGEKKRVHSKYVYPLEDKFRRFPRFALNCSLTQILQQGSKEPYDWTSDDIEFMKGWIAKQEKVVMIIDEEAPKNGKSLGIFLYDLQKIECLNDLFRARLRNKVGEDKKLYKSALRKWNPMVEAHDSYLNTYDLDTDDPACAIYGYVGKDYERLCKHYRETGKCFKGENCKKEHGLFNRSGYTTDLEEIFVDAFTPLKIPKEGDELNIYVTHIVSGTQFYCHINQNPLHRRETLASFVSFMNERENLLKMKKISVPPSVGQLVIAKYSADDMWYRAKVVDALPENDEYSIFFVDYGNDDKVPLSQLRMIRPEFLHFPFQSIFCEMDGVVSAPDKLGDSMAYLYEACSSVARVKVLAVLQGFTPHLIVRLSNADGDVAKTMMENNLIVPAEQLMPEENKFTPG